LQAAIGGGACLELLCVQLRMKGMVVFDIFGWIPVMITL